MCAASPESFTCTPHNWVFAGLAHLDSRGACDVFRLAGIRKAVVLGDSFMRHLYEGLLLLLTGDYEHGALTEEGKADPDCAGQGQFDEKKCRSLVDFHKPSLCNGNLSLQLDYGAWPWLGEQHREVDLVIWSVGAHPINGDYETRYGVHDPEAVKRGALEPLCNPASGNRLSWLREAEGNEGKPPGPHVIWVSQHARVANGTHADERRARIAAYNDGLKGVVTSVCKFGFLDTFNVTAALIDHPDIPREDVLSMTYDGVHWARGINMVKASLTLQHIWKHFDLST